MTDDKREFDQQPGTGGAAGDPGRRKFVLNMETPEYDPTLDPKSPDFDPEKWKAHTAEVNEQLKETFARVQETLSEAISLQPAADALAGAAEGTGPAFAGVMRSLGNMRDVVEQIMNTVFSPIIADVNAVIKGSVEWDSLRDSLKDISLWAAAWSEITEELGDYLLTELEKPEYADKTMPELLRTQATDDDGNPLEITLFEKAVQAARAAKKIIDAQNAGRALRRQMRENAENKGAIMELRNGALPIFSQKILWDAFAPGRISQIGTLAPDMINKKTGRLEKQELEKGDIVPVNAIDISYKVFMLLNAITANSVENFREYRVADGAIRFYVKGVLDTLNIETRPWEDPQQITLDGEALDRKTAGVLYLERQLKPLLMYIGTTPDGSRYSVLSYDGYDIESDTMTVRSPYLFQLWQSTQYAYSARKKAKEKRIAEGKRPLKQDLKPLEVNTLFKGPAYKEDDTVLEIATYITNVLLRAGKGAHTTKIKYTTLINKCPRLRELLDRAEQVPKGQNKAGHYNTALRKIARAYTVIMNPEECDALKYFAFTEFTPTKEKPGYILPTIETQSGKREIDQGKINWSKMQLTPPTKSTLKGGQICIKWNRIKTDEPDDGTS